MKCLDNELIQRFIDRQVSDEIGESIKDHVSKCHSCAKKIKEHKELIKEVKYAVNLLDEEIDIIPEFKKPARNKITITTKIKLFLEVLSAACIVSFIVFFTKLKKPEENCGVIYYELVDEFDANLPCSEQEYSYIEISNDGVISHINNLKNLKK